jgi:Rrf2 family protein
MLQLTKRTEYGLIALVHLVDQPGIFVSAREIGDAYQVPRRLLAEVLKTLSKSGLLASHRGATGGYMLLREPELVSVAEAVSALEGGPESSSCLPTTLEQPDSLLPILDTSSGCDMSSTCPIKTPIQRLRNSIWSLLQQTTLRDLAAPTADAVKANPLGELLLSAQTQPPNLSRSN